MKTAKCLFLILLNIGCYGVFGQWGHTWYQQNAQNFRAGSYDPNTNNNNSSYYSSNSAPYGGSFSKIRAEKQFWFDKWGAKITFDEGKSRDEMVIKLPTIFDEIILLDDGKIISDSSLIYSSSLCAIVKINDKYGVIEIRKPPMKDGVVDPNFIVLFNRCKPYELSIPPNSLIYYKVMV
jgi:hypothetical protein